MDKTQQYTQQKREVKRSAQKELENRIGRNKKGKKRNKVYQTEIYLNAIGKQ